MITNRNYGKKKTPKKDLNLNKLESSCMLRDQLAKFHPYFLNRFEHMAVANINRPKVKTTTAKV